MFNTALAWAVPPGLANIAWKTYFIFGTFNFAACIHIFFMFPETVGRTLEEVEEIFQQGHVLSAWKIGKDVGKKTLAEVTQKAKELPVCIPIRFTGVRNLIPPFRRWRSTLLTKSLHDYYFFCFLFSRCITSLWCVVTTPRTFNGRVNPPMYYANLPGPLNLFVRLRDLTYELCLWMCKWMGESGRWNIQSAIIWLARPFSPPKGPESYFDHPQPHVMFFFICMTLMIFVLLFFISAIESRWSGVIASVANSKLVN